MPLYYLVIKVITDYQIIVTVLIVAASLKWGDWKNWQRYYPTMLFFTVGDLVSSLVTYNHPLWEFESPLLGTTFSDLLISLVFFAATIIIYLSNFPNQFKEQIGWVLLWVFIYTLTEIVSYYFGFFSYHNGWSILSSFLFNCGMFPLLYLHYRKPQYALAVGFLAACCLVYYFKIPFSSMK